MGLRVTESPIQTAFYILLVILGIVGNAMVIAVIGRSILKDLHGGRNADIILMNMSLSNLLVLVMRNSLLVITDLGLELSSTKECCQILMGVWVWLRTVNVWSTLFLSAFHFQTLRRFAPSAGNNGLQQRAPKALLLNLSLIWFLSYIYSIPAQVFSTKGDRNSTETLMLVSSTTRPLLDCIWNFPTPSIGLIYATISIVIHEVVPIILMAITNLGSLYTLYSHSRSNKSFTQTQNGPMIKRVPAERRAAKVILTLILLFIVSWGTSIISVNYFNYNRGSSAEFLFVTARFTNTIFIAMSPLVLALGHRGIRSFLRC